MDFKLVSYEGYKLITIDGVDYVSFADVHKRAGRQAFVDAYIFYTMNDSTFASILRKTKYPPTDMPESLWIEFTIARKYAINHPIPKGHIPTNKSVAMTMHNANISKDSAIRLQNLISQELL